MRDLIAFSGLEGRFARRSVWSTPIWSNLWSRVRSVLADNTVMLKPVTRETRGSQSVRPCPGCKVVGIDLRDVEHTTMSIRDIEGVLDTTTSIILDDTDYELGREKWPQLIRKNLAKIEPGLPKSYDDLSNDDISETPDV